MKESMGVRKIAGCILLCFSIVCLSLVLLNELDIIGRPAEPWERLTCVEKGAQVRFSNKKRHKWSHIFQLTEGWGGVEDPSVWTVGKKATIHFTPDPSSKFEGILTLKANYNKKQTVTIKLNDQEIGSYTIPEGGVEMRKIKFDPILLKSKQINVLEFDIPDARVPGNGDGRTLGLLLESMTFE